MERLKNSLAQQTAAVKQAAADWQRYVNIQFDAAAYLQEELKLKQAYYWLQDEGYFFEILVDAGEGETSSFTVSLIELANPAKAKELFFQHTGHKPVDLPASIEEELWLQVVEEIKKQASRLNRISQTAEQLEQLRLLIIEAAKDDSTENLEEYLNSRFLLIFRDPATRQEYIQLSRLYREIAEEPLFKHITLQGLAKLLRKLGATPVRYGHRRIRLWELDMKKLIGEPKQQKQQNKTAAPKASSQPAEPADLIKQLEQLDKEKAAALLQQLQSLLNQQQQDQLPAWLDDGLPF